MKLRFLGTRGEIELRSPRHRRHSSLLVSHRGRSLLIDCGLDWLGRLGGLRPAAVLLTHAHPDHAAGLRHGSPWPVYATEETWSAIARYPIEERELVRDRLAWAIGEFGVEAFRVEHSVRAPAVGFRIAAGGAAIFYAPDVVSVHDRSDAFVAVDLYVGDGAAIRRSIIRRRDGVRIGHASIREQLEWCAEEEVEWAIFTHCGSEIVRGAARDVGAQVRALGRERGVEASIAYDGLELRVP